MHKQVLGVFALTLCALALSFGFPHSNSQTVSAESDKSPRTATGTIAYAVDNQATGDEIWLIQPDGSQNRRIFSTGSPHPDIGSEVISGLAWRPDGGEIAFTSNHEDTCSWYNFDVYAINSDGTGYRRVTNSPACAGLASYPKGTVTLNTSSSYGYQIYVQGAPGPLTAYSGTTTFRNVADFGNTLQPVTVINGGDRWMGGAVDVKAGQTVDGGAVPYTTGTDEQGAFNPAWKRDGSRIGYAFGCADLRGIADHPAAGDYGQPLFDATGVSTCAMAYGPTAATANNILYFDRDGNNPGIYQTSENGTTKTAAVTMYDPAVVFHIQYLPDASGFIYTWADHPSSSQVYRYDFQSDTITQLTNFSNEFARDFAISPDGQFVVFERAPDELTASYGGASDLWIMGIDGSNLRMLLAGGSHPSWVTSVGQSPAPTPTTTSGGSSTGTSAAFKLYIPIVKK